MRLPVYLDHHATTPLDPRVLGAMLPFFGPRFGNPSSRTHSLGWDAAQALEIARASVARAIGAHPEEIVFTSGATESDNLALTGAAIAAGPGRLITFGATEHLAVLGPARRLAEHGFRTAELAVDRRGAVDPGDLEPILKRGPLVLSLMAANNEIGTLHDLGRIGSLTRRHGVLLHSDMAQAFGRVPIRVEELGVDLASLSAHKIHGPKGIGALYIRREAAARIRPLLVGGDQEGGLRSGTPNLPAIVGFGKAAELAAGLLEPERTRLASLRDRLLGILREGLDGVATNGHPTARLPNNLSVRFEGIDGEALATALPDVAISTGSACASMAGGTSHVLAAIGLDAEQARGTVRFGLGRFTTAEEIEYAGGRVVEEVRRLRLVGGILAASLRRRVRRERGG